MHLLICAWIQELGQSAAEFLETASRESLVRAVREYGEERRWSRVVNAILDARGTGVLQRTMSAAELVSNAVGGLRIRQRIHPATKTFQGIRIAINGEMEALAVTLPKAFRSHQARWSSCGNFLPFIGGSDGQEVHAENGGSPRSQMG